LFVGQCYGGGAEGGVLRSWDLEFVFWASEEMVGLDCGIGFLMMELGMSLVDESLV